MLTEIKLTNFKCFKEETCIPLSKFNLFTGVNGAGKSTALQALLLMRQSAEYDIYTPDLVLNGICVNLGSFEDIKNKYTPREELICLGFTSEYTGVVSINYYLKLKDDMNVSISTIEICQYVDLIKDLNIDTTDKYRVHRLLFDESSGLYFCFEKNITHDIRFRLDSPLESYSLPFIPNFDLRANDFNVAKIHFISADRIGPQEVYQKFPLSKFRYVGKNGELAVNLLNKLAQEPVNETLCLGDDAKTLLTQTEAWMSQILNADIKLKITPFRVNILELLINDLKPSNVGFGYSSILPIVVTGLIAQPGEKIIIENPEIHLHPKAQSALIEFLIKVANTGVQVFIESHSDHVLNAVRIAVLKKQIKQDDANILYFRNSKVQQIKIEEDANIEQWPEDFFDQMDKDLNIMLGI